MCLDCRAAPVPAENASDVPISLEELIASKRAGDERIDQLHEEVEAELKALHAHLTKAFARLEEVREGMDSRLADVENKLHVRAGVVEETAHSSRWSWVPWVSALAVVLAAGGTYGYRTWVRVQKSHLL